MNDLGEKIQRLRKNKNFSQEELAQKMNVTRQAISKWERNEGLPDLYNVKHLAEVLGVSIDELLDHQKEVSKHEDKRKLSDLLLTIPMGLILLGHVVLILYAVINSVIMIQGFIYLDNIIYGINMQLIFVPVALSYSRVMITSWLGLRSNVKDTFNRWVLCISFGVLFLVAIIVFIVEELEGYAFIFALMLILAILIMGFVGAYMYHDITEKPLVNRTWYRKTKRYTGIFTSIYLSILVLSLAQVYVFTKQIPHIDLLEINQPDEVFYMKFETNQINRRKFDHFKLDLKYSTLLEDTDAKVMFEISIGGVLFYESEMTKDEQNPALYHIDCTEDFIELPLISVKKYMDIRNSQFVDVVISYEEGDIGYITTISIAVQHVEYSYSSPSVWIWNNKHQFD